MIFRVIVSFWLLGNFAHAQFSVGPSGRYAIPSSSRAGERISKTKCDEYANITGVNHLYCYFSNGVKFNSVPYVFGGMNASAAEFPHMAAIGFPHRNGGYSFNCGGSLISEKFVLTAAHCNNTDKVAAEIVRLGDRNLVVTEPELPELDVPIAAFIIHERYNQLSRENDIALIRLRSAVPFSFYIRPACLYQGQVGSIDTLAIDWIKASGWGYTTNEGHRNDILQKVTLKTVERVECQKAYENSSLTISSSQFCAGDLAGGKDTCEGDSGGPLQMRLVKDCVITILGVVSFGSIHCGQKGRPGVYTDVSSYLDWIEPKVWSV